MLWLEVNYENLVRCNVHLWPSHQLALDHQSLRSRQRSRWYKASIPPKGLRSPPPDTSTSDLEDEGPLSTKPFRTLV